MPRSGRGENHCSPGGETNTRSGSVLPEAGLRSAASSRTAGDAATSGYSSSQKPAHYPTHVTIHVQAEKGGPKLVRDYLSLSFLKKDFYLLGGNYLLSDNREGVMGGCADQKRPIRWCCTARALYPQRACETRTLPGAPASLPAPATVGGAHAHLG